MTEDMILRNRTPKTIKAYTGWVADFARHFHASPDRLGPEHVRSYLLHLVQERQASCNVQKQARLALQFLYRITLDGEWVVEKVACTKARSARIPPRPRLPRRAGDRKSWRL